MALLTCDPCNRFFLTEPEEREPVRCPGCRRVLRGASHEEAVCQMRRHGLWSRPPAMVQNPPDRAPVAA